MKDTSIVAPGMTTPSPFQPSQRSDMLGTNLAFPDYYSGSFAFVNAMHHADPFHSGTVEEWKDGRTLKVDSKGWVQRLEPGQLARTFIYAGGIHHPTGTITVLYDGRGTIEYRGRVSDLVRAPGRDTFTLQGQDGLYLELTSIDAADPLKNIRVFQPGGRCADDVARFCGTDQDCEGGNSCQSFASTATTQPFHPTFLSEVAQYKVLRFMDWMQTNREVALQDGVEEPKPVSQWSDLPSPADVTWKPVPVSVMIDLANTLDADPWITIPHQADDEFVRKLATLLRDRIDLKLKVYVEYSNETWNSIFDQYRWVAARGCEAFSSDLDAECGRSDGELCPQEGPWNKSQERCAHYGRLYHARRTAQVLDIFADVFGPQSESRVVGVLAGQVGTVDHHGKTMLEATWRDRPVAERIDAFAIAPYFGSEIIEHVDAAFAIYSKSVHSAPRGTYRLLAGGAEEPSGGPYSWIKADVTALKSAYPQIDLVAYEAGQHFFSFDTKRAEVFHQINRDARMKDLYLQYLGMWSELTDSSLMVHFTSPSSWTQFGCFGIKEYLGQPLSDAPKADAIASFIGRQAQGPRPSPVQGAEAPRP